MKEFDLIISDLKKKVYHPVYFLMGEEPYYIDAVADFIAMNVLDEAEKEFNQSILYGRDVDVLTIISEAKRYPMMANHQVVIVKEAQNVKDIEGLATYFENPLKSTILVICYKYKTIDKRKTFAKNLVKSAVLLESKKLYDNKIPEWINAYLKGKNYIIGPKAGLLLTEFLGNDLSKISNELDKLMLNIPEKSEITTAHIEQYIGISKDFNNFELQSALGKRDVLKVNRIINYFDKNQKDNPFVLTIAALFSYFSKILIYHYLPNKSNNNEVAAAMKVHPFFVKDYEMTSRNYNIKKTVEIISFLREYDLKSKGVDNASAGSGELLKELMYKILH